MISRSVRKAGIANLYGVSGTENATGDQQKKIDVLSNEMFINSLYNSHVCCVLVSEENDDPIIVPPGLAGKSILNFVLLYNILVYQESIVLLLIRLMGRRT